MDTPNNPNPVSIPTLSEPSIPPDQLKAQAAEIAAIVERDRKRRKRTLYVLFGLLLITTALAGVIFAVGRSDEQRVDQKLRDSMGNQVDTIVTRVEKELPQVINKEVNTIVEKTVDETVDAQVTPRLDTLAYQIKSIEAEPDSSPSVQQFSYMEAEKIKKAISVDLPKQTESLQQLSGQLDEIAAVSNAAKGETWNKDKSEVMLRLEALEDKMIARVAQLNTLSEKLEAVVRQIGGAGLKDPCGVLSESESTTFRTYSVKEDTTSRLYDLDFKVRLKGVKDGTVRSLTIFRPGSGSESVLLAKRDVMMGQMVSFEDETLRYTLIPIFINRRSLAKDFVGLAISTARKCTPPN